MALLKIFASLFGIFFKIGLFTIGGGYAMIPMIKAEVVNMNWMSVNDLIDFIAIAESTPGPFAINIATYVGTIVGGQSNIWQGIVGAIFATVGVVLPSFLIILLIAKYFDGFKDNRYVSAALIGIRPAVVGLIAAAAFTVAIGVFLGLSIGSDQNLFTAAAASQGLQFNWRALIIGALAFGFSRWKKKLHPIWMILGAAALGILFFGLPQVL